jgi:tocopherol O-methyltransferase
MIYPNSPQNAAAVALHYDALDAAYRAIWGEHVHHGYWRTGRETPTAAAEELTALVGEYLAVRPGQALCDIGCGYGASAEYFATRHGCDVTGLSLSSAQLEIARQRGGSVQFLQRDWLENGLGDASFDGAYSIESSEHMKDKARFFTEAVRVLRPGGRLVVCAWLARSSPSPSEIKYLLEPICREGRLPSMGNREEYADLAAAAGLEPIGFEDISQKVRRTWSICARRIAWKFLSDRELRGMALDPELRDRSFLLTIPRLMIALRYGAMRYGVFAWRKA